MQALRPKLWAPLVLVLGGAGAFAATQGAPVEAADHNDPPNRVHSTAFGTPRATTDDGASDIADVFAWNRDVSGTQHTVVALSFDGPNPATPAFALPCDPDVLYQIHITADGGVCPTMMDDGTGTIGTCSAPATGHPCGQVTPAAGSPIDCASAFTDIQTINVRFAHVGSATSRCLVEAQFAGAGSAPISANTVAGPIETNIVNGSVMLYAGLRDDAFFFDLQGFHDTQTDGMLSHIMHTRDSFAGTNTPVIVIDFPTSAITRSTHALPPTGSVIRVWASTSRYRPHT